MFLTLSGTCVVELVNVLLHLNLALRGCPPPWGEGGQLVNLLLVIFLFSYPWNVVLLLGLWVVGASVASSPSYSSSYSLSAAGGAGGWVGAG